MQTTTQQPVHRGDVKGNIAGIKQDFISSLRAQLEHDDNFLLAVEDANAYDEYAKYLTPAEMQACFKKALRPA